MARRLIYLSLVISIVLISQCGQKKGSDTDGQDGETAAQQQSPGEQQKSRDRITARTMGLAYLEENKLEEAEREFLKLIELAPDEAIGYANLGLVYMRMGKYEEAETQLKKALEIDPDDPDIRLNLATVYEMSNKGEASIEELKKNVELAPDHVKSLYSLAESYQGSADKNSMDEWEKYMKMVVENTPSNIVARLHLVEALLRNKKADEALAQLEEIPRLYPEMPEDAREFYDQAISQLKSSKPEEALTSVLIFHNFMKLTNPYQTGIQELKGAGGSNVGNPVITFSQATTMYLSEGESLLDAIRFTDATASAGLDVLPSDLPIRNGDPIPNTHFAIADMDRDGDHDIYVGSFTKDSKYEHFLFKSDLGRFSDIGREAGIRHSGVETYGCFADYDNDGFLDLYLAMESENRLYWNENEGQFKDLTDETGVGDESLGYKSLLFDLDHDGDLDIFLANRGKNTYYRNNADGTFEDRTEALNLSGGNLLSRDAGFNDFDDDGDVDLLVINENGNNLLYSSLRQGGMKDVSKSSGLGDVQGSTSVAIGDYDNDGYADLFVTNSTAGKQQLFKNAGKMTFETDGQTAAFVNPLQQLVGHDAEFFDFDNDGFLDLLIVGASTSDGPNALLFHNDGQGVFEDVSHLLPDNLPPATQIVIADYNEDGDMDIFLANQQGGVRLLRNDGGNANHHLRIQLVGIRTGSGKNNYYGVGAKVEVRAAELYQAKTITGPDVHFGLGAKEKADVVRILWTNGVPQNIFSPGSDQDLIEEQELKGSCPFLYTWNGEEYVFVKDLMWRSALGMPMGIMGGTTTYAFANASDEYIKVPGNLLKAKDGMYSLQVTSELWETIYFDRIQLVAVDHPQDIEIFVDEKFTPPPFPGLKVYPVSKKHVPIGAIDGKGNDVLSYISEKDDKYLSTFNRDQYQGVTETHHLILDLGNVENLQNLHLFLNGWIFPTDASINVALSQNDHLASIPPRLQVMDEHGKWVTVIENIGFPMGKDKTVVIDLSDKFITGERKVRITTNMEIYWDQVFWDNVDFDIPVKIHRTDPYSADLHYRGFSRMYRKGGRYGPHWFDYSDVTAGPKWRDLTGAYTRYGDVVELLKHTDDRYIISNAGDEVTIKFREIPAADQPYARDYLIYSVGWVKDGDLNTAAGQTVEPLPFHGMHEYPYSGTEKYPDTKDFRKYHRTYNTRMVEPDEFRNALKN